MAKAVGVKVYQYGLDGKFIQSYDSIGNAARAMLKTTHAIHSALDKYNRTSCGYIWKTTGPNTIEHI